MTVGTPTFFFSYGRADAEFAVKLANDLRSAGISLWIDQLDIPAGDRWDIAAENALKACPCLLVVLSPASVESQNVMDEVAYALENNKKVVPVLHRRCDIPFRIKRLHYIDFTATYDSGLTQLLRALNAPQTVGGGKAAPAATRSGRRISTRRLVYPLVALLLVAVVGLAYRIAARGPINVIAGTYGENCKSAGFDVSHGNVTGDLASKCNGLDSCEYIID